MVVHAKEVSVLGLEAQTLLDAYRRMRAIREFERKLAKSSRQRPGLRAPLRGQEAVAVGACMHLWTPTTSAARIAATATASRRACDIGGMMPEIFGKQGGLCKGKGGSMHIADLRKGMLGANGIVGARHPIAVGAALTAKTLGDGRRRHRRSSATARPTRAPFHESLNFAAVLKLPVIFMYENNGYSRIHAVPATTLAAQTLPRVRRHSACPPRKWMAWIFSRYTTRLARRSSGRAVAMARAQSRHRHALVWTL